MKETIERGFITDWADYRNAEDHPEEGCDFWIENDGGMQDFPGMTVDEVIDDLAKDGWETDEEVQARYVGTELGASTWMIRRSR